MKTQEEIEQLAEQYIKDNTGDHYVYCGYVDGYTQCQEDMALQGKCLSGKSYNNCHIHSDNIFGCLSCGNFERNKQD